jgi:hypothetical protein
VTEIYIKLLEPIYTCKRTLILFQTAMKIVQAFEGLCSSKLHLKIKYVRILKKKNNASQFFIISRSTVLVLVASHTEVS